jgi:hypothetical protein
LKRLIITLLAAIIAVGLLSGMGLAMPSYLTTSGSILVPDDSVLATGSLSADLHVLNFDENTTILGANFGVAEGLEVGISRFDPEASDSDVKTVLSGKYMLQPETAGMPSIVIGVLDATGELESDGDPSFYAVIGKNLTPIATDLADMPVQPMRGFIGVGTGIYNGVFAGINWAFNSRASLLVEYSTSIDIVDTIDDDSVFDAGLRFQIADGLYGDVSLLNGKDMGFGISLTKAGL